MTWKFRRSLEPHINAKPDGPRRTALKPTGNLTIGFSGGLGSTVLLDLVNRYYVSPDKSLVTAEGGRDHPRNERVWKKVTVCYVEVCDAFPEMKDRTDEIREIVQKCEGVDFLPIHIQDAFDRAWWEKMGGKPVLSQVKIDMANENIPFSMLSDESLSSSLSALRTYIASLPTPTALSNALRSLTRVLLQYAAHFTDSSHLLLGASLTSLAVSLISSISQGGGFHVREEAQEEWFADVVQEHAEDSRHKKGKWRGGGVRVIRPLRDVGMKECAAWAWWMQLRVVGREKWRWPGAKVGIGKLTKDFIAGLEKDYPSTVSTIVRTCGKLAPKGGTVGKCLICERPVPEGVQEWKARISIRSHETPSDAPVPLTSPDLTSLAPFICYVCHTTLTSKGTRAAPPLFPPEVGTPGMVSLPSWSNARMSVSTDGGESNTGRRIREPEMREIVKEYLLDD
ncbi:hypothetical protein PHLCEN_2v9039 [Hermanssonia centrifuga]|uniref:Cytoplasmic tRNA 2-thiolation protein 2 n=1 Tax=Hermanssonia centrifuga TaxID=98765 RepID=A0A2R6NS01_9APHY|nr:hypothetical protein PHLCEN_2v9039 [Hermanssonia centrifuga]